MKTAVTIAPGQIEIVDRPAPEPGIGEALLRVERVGICGSDLHFYRGHHPYASYPRTQGHEFSGIVVGYGGDGDQAGPVAFGERVAVEPLLPCGDCYPCRQNRPNCCVRLRVIGAHVDGAMAERIAVPIERLYPTGDLDAELAALVEPVSIGVQAAARGDIGPSDRVVVFGAGPIGQAVILAAVDRGARVMAVDRLPTRLALARLLGAEETVEAGRESAAVAAWTGGEGPSVTVDAVGAPAVIRACVELVASAGRVVVIGLSDQEVSLPVIDFTRKELTILGSRNSAGLFGRAVDLVSRRRDVIRSLITHRYPLERVAEAIEFADQHPAEAEKVMLEVV